MNKIQRLLIGLAIFPLTVGDITPDAQAGQVISQWYFGKWDCTIDGRAAKMQWLVVDDPQTTCSGDICRSSSGVRVIGKFREHGGGWVPLAKRYLRGNDFGIRYQGGEPDNWKLTYNPQTRIANGWTTWRGNRYPLQCRLQK